MTKGTVLIVDDSRFMRSLIESELQDRGFETATAKNGEEAVAAVETVDPDVITMDVEMPVMDGIEAVECIMNSHSIPIIMLSAHTEEGADTTFDALDKGAVDFITKPGGEEVTMDMDEVMDNLVSTITAVADVNATTSYPPQQKPLDAVENPDEPLTPTDTDGNPVIILGASTGGPRLIESILRDLPVGLHARVLVVQHMPKTFTTQFTERLDTISPYSVSEVTETQSIGPGEVGVAAGDQHLRVTRDNGDELWVEPADSDPRAAITPSIDVTLLDAAENLRSPCVSVMLSGMGADGQRGVQMLHRAGGRTIAQDEDTATVFGIPKRAIETGCVDAVLPGDKIVPGVTALLNSER